VIRNSSSKHPIIRRRKSPGTTPDGWDGFGASDDGAGGELFEQNPMHQAIGEASSGKVTVTTHDNEGSSMQMTGARL
jgi:hypothetical protein